MSRKLVVLFLALLITSTAIVGVFNHRNGTINIASAAEGSSGGGDGQGYQPIINYSYVWEKTRILSEIVNDPESKHKGRAFGTYGEQKAANYIQGWMNETLDPKNVTREEINKRWTIAKATTFLGGIGLWKAYNGDESYVGLLSPLGMRLNKTRKIHSHWICIKAYYKSNGTLAWKKNLTYKENGTSSCFPLLRAPRHLEENPFKPYIVDIAKNLTITETFDPSLENQCIVLHVNWKEPFKWAKIVNNYTEQTDNIKAFILVDCFDDTYFMSPSRFDAISRILKKKGPEYPVPGYSITRKDWNEIKTYLYDDRYVVKVDIYSNWSHHFIKSYNVIGKLEGRSPKNIVDIVCAHYDCWWNQGTIDEAAETALVLGIAKYMKELEKEKGIKPRYTVKFIAFAGEELGFRGSLDYLLKHVRKRFAIGKEKVRYVINPGNFGHNDSVHLNGTQRDLNFCVNKGCAYLGEIASNIAESLNYTGWMKHFYGNNAWGTRVSWTVSGEDAQVFNATKCRLGTIQFSRNPFKGYHRDGDNHEQGDVLHQRGPFCGLVNNTFTIESDIVLLTTLYLCYEDIIKENLTILDCSNQTFDSGKDGRADSVRILFNVSSIIPTGAKIKAELFDVNDLSKNVTYKHTKYFLIGENGTAHGSIVLSPLTTESPGKYKAKLELYDVNGTLVDEEWTEPFFLNLLDVPIANFTYTPSDPTDIDNITFNAENHSYPSAPENGSGDADIVNYTWDFGDGSYEYGGVVTHRYADDGYYNVTLTILDTNGKSASITKQIHVRNVPPEVNFTIEPSQIVTVGEIVYLNSTIYEPDGYIVNYTWDFGDGSYSYTRNATHVYTKSGFYKVTFTAMDDDNDSGTRTKWIWVFDGIVDDDYPRDDPANRRWKSIQNAINSLGNEEMIFVYNGTYNESLLIEKRVKLYGESTEGTIINGGKVAVDVLRNSSLEIYNFTIKSGGTGINIKDAKPKNKIFNCRFYSKDAVVIDNTSYNLIKGCKILNGNTGIRIENSVGNRIEKCSMSSLSTAIYISRSSFNTIDNCSLKLNENSIYLYRSNNNTIERCYIEVKGALSVVLPSSNTGIKLIESNCNSISVCNISNATAYGICISSSSKNFITLCNLYKNGYGVYLVASSKNAISSCNFVNNTGSGVATDPASSNNTIYYNNFICNGITKGNIIQAYDAGTGNLWYLPTSETFVTNSSFGEGNFWIDYTGNDTDGDGIGDEPYTIPGPSASQDLYPLAEPCKWDEWFGINWGSRDDPWVRSSAPFLYL